ncbi:Mitochondrial division protein 1 [Durusdinium trenchii]|uniref:Mitochondrial division protein 1 n=1 Tax=Durusdinium trenchii TaxID=1381693 RepID=A0ABP0N8V1_9DINO
MAPPSPVNLLAVRLRGSCRLAESHRSEPQKEMGNGPGGIGALAVNWKMHSAICGCGELLEVWDMASKGEEDTTAPQRLQILRGHTQMVTAIHVDWAQGLILSAAMDCTLRRWDLRSGELLKTFPVLSGEIRCMSLVDDASVVTGDERGNLQVWDLEGGLVQRVLTAHKVGAAGSGQVWKIGTARL